VTKSQDQLHNVNVVFQRFAGDAREVKRRMPLTDSAAGTVLKSRETVRAILERRDPRMFVVVVRAPFTTWLPRANMQAA